MRINMAEYYEQLRSFLEYVNGSNYECVTNDELVNIAKEVVIRTRHNLTANIPEIQQQQAAKPQLSSTQQLPVPSNNQFSNLGIVAKWTMEELNSQLQFSQNRQLQPHPQPDTFLNPNQFVQQIMPTLQQIQLQHPIHPDYFAQKHSLQQHILQEQENDTNSRDSGICLPITSALPLSAPIMDPYKPSRSRKVYATHCRLHKISVEKKLLMRQSADVQLAFDTELNEKKSRRRRPVSDNSQQKQLNSSQKVRNKRMEAEINLGIRYQLDLQEEEHIYHRQQWLLKAISEVEELAIESGVADVHKLYKIRAKLGLK